MWNTWVLLLQMRDYNRPEIDIGYKWVLLEAAFTALLMDEDGLENMILLVAR